MLTATIEQKMFSLHQTSSISKCCTHTQQFWITAWSLCQRSDWTSSTEITVARPIICFSNSNKYTKITTVYNNKHLDGGLRSHFFFFSPKKQTHNQKFQLVCSSQSQTSLSLSIISLNSFRRTQKLSMWINDGSLAKQSYARAFAWSNESTFQKRGYIQYIYIAVLFS